MDRPDIAFQPLLAPAATQPATRAAGASTLLLEADSEYDLGLPDTTGDDADNLAVPPAPGSAPQAAPAGPGAHLLTQALAAADRMRTALTTGTLLQRANAFVDIGKEITGGITVPRAHGAWVGFLTGMVVVNVLQIQRPALAENSAISLGIGACVYLGVTYAAPLMLGFQPHPFPQGADAA